MRHLVFLTMFFLMCWRADSFISSPNAKHALLSVLQCEVEIERGGPSTTDLRRMVKSVSMRASKGEVHGRYQSGGKQGGVNRKGFGQQIDKVKETVNVGKKSRSETKKEYRALVQIAKKSPTLSKVVGVGKDAKLPKQKYTSGNTKP